uniref:Hypotaurocyamine kinase n=1 Tax=Siphonosoma cumanense TaxID=6444 RepID=Q4AED0_SIPCU|nr:hypotaurocyamine kinase [Siphonosoma cumanense]BAE54374.1 hypotaurocyamine kinase [Siphonosoma cumanense]
MAAIDYDGFMKKLHDAKDCHSLAKKFVTPEAAKKFKDKKTKLGGTLAHCIKPGAQFHHLHIGIYACDPEAYVTFAEVFDKVVADYHGVPSNQPISHPAPNFGDLNNLPFNDLDPEGKYVISTRVRVGRSVDGIPFPPLINLQQVKDCEQRLVSALKTFQGDLSGQYYSLEGMDEATKNKLIDDHFLFGDPPNKILVGAGVEPDWPKGRGIFHNNSKTFLAWINEEDHIRIISMQMGGNLAEVYKRLVTAIQHIEKTVKFAHDPRLGYLTFCPSNLGTTCRASVHVKIPKVSALKNFKGIVECLGLQLRGTAGEHTESVGGVWDVSNKRRLGYSEIDALTEMANGVKLLILLEKSLE